MNTETNKRQFNSKAFLKAAIPYLGLVAVIIVFQIASKGVLLTPKNIKLLINQSFIIMIGGMGCSFVVAQGNLDFSIGGIVGVSAAVGALIGPAGGAPASAILGTLVGCAVGCVIGLLHVKFRVPAFIGTICMMFVLRGLTWVLNDFKSIAAPASFVKLDTLQNKIIIVVIVFIIIFILFEYTKLGKYSKAIGANPLAAEQSGVPVKKMKVIAYAISGLVAGMCGFLALVRTGTSNISTGVMFEVNVLTAMVLGGMSLSGGPNARMKAGVIGALMLAIITNGMTLWGLNDKWQSAVQGIILIGAVAISYDRKSSSVLN